MRANKITIILIIAFICLLALNVFYPRKIESTFLTVLISIATFLFGIFISFSISDRHGRINELRNNDSLERGYLILMHKYAGTFGKKYQTEMAEAIDQYLISTLDYEIKDFHKNEKFVDAIYNKIESAKVTNDQQREIYSEFLDCFSSLIEARRKTIALITDRLSRFEWLVATFLPFIILLSTILTETNSLIVAIISSILSVMILNITLFLYTLDSLSWKEERRIFEPYQQTFEAIGRLRYYPEILIKHKRVKMHKNKIYRLGIFPNKYPDLSGKTIRTIDDRNDV
ncbi:MAG: hypothetical protein AABX23_04050 [Nanoarchaeota archaeon]